MNQRVEKLFPSLTGFTWKNTLDILENSSIYNYEETSRFCEDIRKARNEFLHEGNKFAIRQEMSKQCILHIEPLINMFVDLHNKFISG